MTASAAHWSSNATHWQQLGSPLRPSAEDAVRYAAAVRNWRSERGDPPCRILLLGVTQELRALDWPADSELVACDLSHAMIERIWPLAGFSGSYARPLCTDWRALPLRAAACNIAIGDGSASALANLDELRRAADELHRVLEPGAALILRLFLRPVVAEDPRLVAAEAEAGRIGSFHAFKWRLAMAVQRDARQGVRLGEVWDAFQALFPDRTALAAQTGWAPQAIATIDSYREADGRYNFHTLDEFSAAIAPAFRVVSVDYPGYELGERCPLVAARRCD